MQRVKHENDNYTDQWYYILFNTSLNEIIKFGIYFSSFVVNHSNILFDTMCIWVVSMRSLL